MGTDEVKTRRGKFRLGGLENQGLLRGVTVPVITAVMIGAALSFACGTNAVCKDYEFLPEKYKHLEPDKEQIEKVKRDFEKLKDRKIKINAERLLPAGDKISETREKYKHLTEFNKEEIEKLKDALLTGAGQKRIWESFLETPPPENVNSEEKVIFYLFSRSVPATTVDNVFGQAKKLKGIKFYGVIRGIDREVLHYITSLKNFGQVRIKINPLIFEKVGAEVVPAFVFAKCRTVMGILRTESCEFKAVLYGDVSLEWAVEKYEGGIR